MRTVRPEPAEGVRLYILDDEGVLFHAAAQKLYRLNTAATLVWCLLEEGLDQAAMTASYAADLGIPPDRAAAQVAESLTAWHALGLLAGGRLIPELVPPAPPIAAGLPPWRPTSAVEEHSYRLLDAAFRIRYSSVEQAAWVHPILAHLASETEIAPAHIAIDVVADGDRLVIYQDRQPRYAVAALERLAPIVKAMLWRNALEQSDFFLDIHAGVVARHGQGLLLPAPPGSGKTTLSAALARSGFDYLSDEVALLTASLAVRPFRLDLSVKSTGWDTLLPFYPELATARTHIRGDGKIVRYLPPPGAPLAADACPVRAIVFPRYDAAGQSTLTPLGKAAALERLLSECVAIPKPLDVARVGQLVNWIGHVDCYALRNADLGQAIALLQQLTADW